uniref:Uncharacterized protein n=1 Tax=Ananas comosus var. bracteatus TaxID=296719 RepID=A0A6V7NTI7_ANACO|nr:unnamed protein product [Ananas comosus var. bracteatus]
MDGGHSSLPPTAKCQTEDRRLHIISVVVADVPSWIGGRSGGRARIRSEPGHGCRGRPIASDYEQSKCELRFARERRGGARQGRSSVDSGPTPETEITVPRGGLA